MLQRVPGPREARRTYVLHDADIERRLRAGTTLVWNHGLKHLCKTFLKSDENTANHSLPCQNLSPSPSNRGHMFRRCAEGTFSEDLRRSDTRSTYCWTGGSLCQTQVLSSISYGMQRTNGGSAQHWSNGSFAPRPFQYSLRSLVTKYLGSLPLEVRVD